MLPPLFDALARRDAPAVRQFLREGADPNAISPFHGQSILYNACVTSDVESTRVLLDHGADPNLRLSIKSVVDGSIEQDVTVLMYVTAAKIAELLIEFGADVHAQDHAGTTALMKAALFGKLEVLEILLKSGATDANHAALRLAETKLQFWRERIGDPGMKQAAVEERIRVHEAIVRMLRQAGDG